MHVLHLTTKGQLWSANSRLLPDSNGVLMTAFNSSNVGGLHRFELNHENVAHHPALFYAFDHVAFDSDGENCACIDKRGNLFIFRLKLNRYALVKRIGIATTALCFSKHRTSEIFVALKDCSIHCYNIGKFDYWLLLDTLNKVFIHILSYYR